MKGRDRNNECWCGSGKKAKKCHANRQCEDPVNPWELQKAQRRLFDSKVCLHANSGSGCRGQIIRAHTVRRAADLKAIARDGHVYQTYVDFKVLNQTGGKAVAKLVGINDASTFWGFCAMHDASTFSPLENQSFGPTPEQVFLLAYRPLVKELYLKQRQLQSADVARVADKGKPHATQIAIQQFINLHQAGVSRSIEDLEKYKTLFDRDLLARDFSHVRFVVVHFDRAPDVMCSGVLQPHFTFDGKRIQRLGDLDTDLELIAYSLIATDAGGAAVLAWRDESATSAIALVDSLLALDQSDIPHALLRYALSDLENSYMSPTWWEALSEQARAALTKRLSDNLGPTNPVGPRYLCDDGIRVAAWKVTKIEQQR